MITVFASNLDRIFACGGSHALSALVPKPEDNDDNAKEGTAAHWCAEQLFKDRKAPLKAGDKAPNGYVIDGLMIAHAAEYVETFAAADLLKRIETPAHFKPPVADPKWEVRLRNDNVIWHAEQATLAITDFKYGFRLVEPEWNYQLIAGAIGAAMSMNVAPAKFILAIYQPRVPHERGPLRTWEITPDVLYEAYQRIDARLNFIDAGTDELVTGSHCRYCRAAAQCPATQRASYNAVDVILNASALTVGESHLRTELEVLERCEEIVKTRKKWLEELALARLKAGVIVPGLSTKDSLGHTTWIGGIGQVETALGVPLTEPKPITPAEAKRRHGLTDDQLKAHTHRPALGKKLVKAKGAEQAAKAFK